MSLSVHDFFDEPTNTVSYLVIDKDSKQAAIIDSVLDFDYASGRTSTASADAMIAQLTSAEATLTWIIETHVHADHLSAAPYLQQRCGGTIVIGKHICEVQQTFTSVFNMPQVATDGSQFGKLVDDGERFSLGELSFTAIHTPGHTPACMSHHIDNYLFVGDTLFMPDYGSARCDFPGGNASTLFDSVQRLYQYDDVTRMMLCHDYKAPGRDEFVWRTTVGSQKQHNIHLNTAIDKQTFVAKREARDAQLAMPKLIVPSVQVNMAAGNLPVPEDNGVSYLKVPINLL